MLDEDIREYLLYSFLSMQYAMGKQLMLPDALVTQTESNEDWTRQGFQMAGKNANTLWEATRGITSTTQRNYTWALRGTWLF